MATSSECCEVLDPRIRRTRQLLQQALLKLLETKEFDKISVHDIADAATVNRATFYDHYGDKFALLECMVGSRFHELLAEREVQFAGGCAGALKAIVLALCDYLAQMRQLQPHMELAIIAVLRRILLEGTKQPLLAATVSWAIYGAAKEWLQMPDREPSEKIADTVVTLIAPLLGPH